MAEKKAKSALSKVGGPLFKLARDVKAIVNKPSDEDIAERAERAKKMNFSNEVRSTWKKYGGEEEASKTPEPKKTKTEKQPEKKPETTVGGVARALKSRKKMLDDAAKE